MLLGYLAAKSVEYGEEFGVGGANGAALDCGFFFNGILREIVILHNLERFGRFEEFLSFGSNTQNTVVFYSAFYISFYYSLLYYSIKEFRTRAFAAAEDFGLIVTVRAYIGRRTTHHNVYYIFGLEFLFKSGNSFESRT